MLVITSRRAMLPDSAAGPGGWRKSADAIRGESVWDAGTAGAIAAQKIVGRRADDAAGVYTTLGEAGHKRPRGVGNAGAQPEVVMPEMRIASLGLSMYISRPTGRVEG